MIDNKVLAILAILIIHPIFRWSWFTMF